MIINVLNVEHNGNIYFSANEEVDNVTFKVMDRKFDSEIYIKHYEKLINGVTYYINISSVVLPFLKDSYLIILHDDKSYNVDIKFPEGDLGNFSLIGNTCLAWRTYERFNLPYNSPTIGNLILDDEEYVRFCEHINSYLDVEMVFGESKGNVNFKNNCGNVRVINPNAHIPLDYPISHHLDVEIHWIHTKSKELIFKNGVYHFKDLSDRTPLEDYKNKWERRSQRSKNKEKIFLWSASEMFNIHGNWKRKQLIDRFKSLPHRSIFLTERPEEEFEDENHIVKFIPEWRDNNQFQRDSSGGILWNNQEDNSEITYNIIQEKFLK
jgi:uncharacterized protein (DUF1919 family)